MKKEDNFCKTKQLEDENTIKPLLENIDKKCHESVSEDLVNTYNKDLQELYNHVAPIKTKEVLLRPRQNG